MLMDAGNMLIDFIMERTMKTSDEAIWLEIM